MRMEGYTDRGALLTKKIHTIKTFLGLVVRDLTQEEEQRYAIRDIARIAVVWNRPAMHRQCF